MKKLNITLLCLFLPFCIYAQVTTKFIKAADLKTRSATLKSVQVPQFLMKTKINVDSLLKADERDQQNNLPYRFGVAFNVNLGLKDGKWTDVEGGKLWQLQISSAGAHSLNFQFDDFHLASGAELNIYNIEKTMQMGPITASQNTPDNFFATDLIKGEAVMLELFEPDSVAGASKLHIKKAVHAYKPTFTEYLYGESAACNININCPQGDPWLQESNAVAMVLLADGDRWCSGAMINNTCQDLTPYFLTAFHCLNGGEANWVFRFKYRGGCNGGDGLGFISINRATLRASWRPSDFALLELSERPAAGSAITYAGWSRNTAPPASGVGIHHPAGDVMKISIDNNAVVSNTAEIFWNNGTVSPVNSHWENIFDAGGVQPGSSGSPLFNPNHQIVGQLHGGTGFCPGDAGFRSFYGRFDVSWTGGGTPETRLSTWLDPGNTGALATNTITEFAISGAGSVCPTQVFTVNWPTATTWSITPSGIATMTPNGNSVTLSKITDGVVTLTATTVNACGVNVTRSRNIPIGFWGGGVTGFTPVYANSFYYYDLNTNGFSTSLLTWSVPPGWTVDSQSASRVFVTTGTTNGSVTATFRACGSFTSRSMTVTIGSGGPIPPFAPLTVTEAAPVKITVYPNPASNMLKVTLPKEMSVNEKTVSGQDRLGVTVANMKGEIKLIKTIAAGSSNFVINTSELIPGTYILKVQKGLKTGTAQFIIQ